MKSCCAYLLLLGLCAVAYANEVVGRDELRRQRESIEAQFARREQDCRRQFVVTPCVEKASLDKQSALEALRAQELALNEAQRLERAQAQAARVARKAQAAAARADKPVVQRRVKPPRDAASAVEPRPAASMPTVADTAATERRRREEFQARQREIRGHRQEVEKRNAERAARKKPVPLPVPASAASR